MTSNQELDQQAAIVAEREGAVAADKALVDDAQLKLDYTRLVAPISGATWPSAKSTPAISCKPATPTASW